MNRFIWLGLIVLLVAGIWTAGWFYAAAAARTAIASLAEGDGETAPTLSCEVLEVTGFPFRFDLSCVGATIVDGDLSATIAGLKGSVLVYNPSHAVVSAQAPVTLADAFTGSESRVDFTGAEASIRLQSPDLWTGLQGKGWRIARASLIADGLNWTDTLTGENLIASAIHLEAHLLDMPERHEPEKGLSALAAYARLDQVQAPAFDVAGGEVSLEAELSGLPDDLRALDAPAPLRRWRDAGGQLRIVSLKGEAGEDFVNSTGTLALDSAARLEGQLQLTSKGLVERTGTLVPEDWKGLVLGAPAADGSYSQTLNLRGGFIFAGLMPVAQLEPLF
ncbi:MAG: DUF2125 domain-containing protein [Devosia sp.]|nr:DUF2125 domain-containing protein [Devosia sp.]